MKFYPIERPESIERYLDLIGISVARQHYA
ncbi:hypothetical protein ABIF65_010707 [Bradyrhizobium japonicum]|jgi:hypothetical protein|nr:hypothetical protein [Bradyrhizobium japonicum]MCP1776431.1 hypothetical protein [Bradyrhizobium japonicum]MCP1855899.1 hypothetical protein [Bradyrhizobium japonicum]MCP1897286.1 hypothetical protein [Bradyrhizobium japonicum]MCP1960570.1 hypothetical protein [Bradyrhizobium japonicum]